MIAEGNDETGMILYQQYKDILKHSVRVCSVLSIFEDHLASLENCKSAAKCVVCSERTHKKCTLCGVPMHFLDIRGPGKGKKCAIHWHNESYLGLCFDDRKFMSTTSKTWKMWTKTKLKKNAAVMKGYSKR